MKSEIWGPHAWIFLHSIALEYPNNPSEIDKKNMISFFNSLGNVLPCYKCKVNFKKHIKDKPLTDEILSSKNNLVKWLIDIHNSVNKNNNKQVLSYEQALKETLSLYEEGFTNWFIVYICIIIIIITITLYLYSKYKTL